METLSGREARRIALAATGLARPRAEDPPRAADLRRLIARLGLHQIDSVNVLARAHYMPAFSRLGAYDRTLLDSDAWGAKRGRRLFEYWAHEASLLPLALHPLLRWRMARADRGEGCYGGLKPFAGEARPAAMALLDRIRTDGPRSAADCAEGVRGAGGWWGWGEAKQALEWLFWAGHVTTATRRGTFERVYDLPERVLPRAILDLPTPTEAEAQRELLMLSARALGVATVGDLRDYFRIGPEDAKAAIAALVEQGRLLPVEVKGWSAPAYLHPDAKVPRRAEAAALLSPFDPLVWERARTERIFGFRYRIEIYVPAEKRQHGYYCLPFLFGDRLVARVDLKADRFAGKLLVQGLHWEPGAPPDAEEALRIELARMAGWLGLETPALAGVPDLATA